MSTVTKALELLNYFSSETPELGLSEFARAAARDKATVYRHLSALEKSGFIEKNPRTSHYRLGPAVLAQATGEPPMPRFYRAPN